MDPESNEDNSVATNGATPVRQFTIFLANQIGALLSIVDLLKKNHIEVLGVSVKDSVDATTVRLIVSDPEAVEPLFIERGIPYNSTDVIVVELNAGASQLADFLRTLLNAETNIHFVYPVLTRPNGKTAIAMYLEDNEFGQEVLNRAGYRILTQDDLSR